MKEESEDTKVVVRNKEGQTTQWPKEKGQKDKQGSTKNTHKTKDQVTRMKTQLKSSHKNQKSKLRKGLTIP